MTTTTGLARGGRAGASALALTRDGGDAVVRREGSAETNRRKDGGDR